jgi:hypothetical protein
VQKGRRPRLVDHLGATAGLRPQPCAKRKGGPLAAPYCALPLSVSAAKAAGLR